MAIGDRSRDRTESPSRNKAGERPSALKDLTRMLDGEGEAKHVLFTMPMCCFFDCGSAY